LRSLIFKVIGGIHSFLKHRFLKSSIKGNISLVNQ
jgi:hypothetical protein